MDCLFCKFANKEILVEYVYESEDFFAIKDIDPKATIHILIITKNHYRDITEAESNVMAKLPEFIKGLGEKLNIDKNGYRIIINKGKNGGQEVFHLHFHLLGGEKLGGLVC